MILRSIDIENFKGIEKLHVEFQEGVNLLIGNNGAGKTSLLTAIAVLLSDFFSTIISKPGRRIVRETIGEDAYTTTVVIGGAVSHTMPHYPIVIEGTSFLYGENRVHKIIKKNPNSLQETQDFKIPDIFKDSIGDPEVSMPLLCFQRAGRGKTIEGRKDKITLANEAPERSQGYQSSFSKELNMDEIQSWCVQMEFTTFQRKQEIREYKVFQSLVRKFMSMIDENAKQSTVYYSSLVGSLVYFDGVTEQPIHQLSSGYQAIICMIIELAYRAVLLNPAMDDVGEQTEGVVLIDEIEMHLHPTWQWKVIDALKATFPKVQFIIATHSPIILSSAKETGLYFMESPNQVDKINDVYGYNINDVLSILQGSEYQPKAIERYYQDVERIFDNGEMDELNKLLEKVEEEFANEPRVIEEFKSFVEVNRWVEDA